MITTDLRNAAGLAAAGDFIERSALAGATPRPLLGTTLPVPAGIAPARPLAIALRPARARKARSARRPAAGYALAKGAAPKASAVKASKSSSKSSAKSSASDPLAFLKDPKLSVDDKLILLLGYLNQKWEKEMDEKMKEMVADEQKPSGEKGSTSKKRSGGILDSIGGVARDILGSSGAASFIESVVSPAAAVLKTPLVRDVLKQVGGPVLAAGATALGHPELAPVLLKYGPEIVDGATKLAAAFGGESGGGSTSAPSSGSGSASGAGSSKMSESQRQMLLMQIERIKHAQQEMFGLVSSCLKSTHDTRMAVVNNIR
jgi:hypothetical protein